MEGGRTKVTIAFLRAIVIAWDAMVANEAGFGGGQENALRLEKLNDDWPASDKL